MSVLVVVIDDSLVVRKILEVCLHRAGYPVKSFLGGVEVFRWLETPEAHIPDLVFVDICLPVIDGYGIIQKLKARPAFAQTVFVIISQYNGVLDRLKGRLAGAKDYLVKPLKTAELVAVAQASLGTPSLANEEPLNTQAPLKEGTGSSLFPPSGGQQSLQGRKKTYG
jgi:twitching motility two-component system response regulator PilG